MSTPETSTHTPQPSDAPAGASAPAGGPFSEAAAPREDDRRQQRRGGRNLGLRIGAALASALLGFLLVAQARATEGPGDRLATEREEDLTRILADLTAEADRLQGEITELRLTLIEFESSAEQDELALRSLRRRLDDLRVLTGVVATEGEGITLTIADPGGLMTQELLVDTVQELRDAGAEAIAVNGVRLVASSSFMTRNARLIVDGQPLEAPYRVTAIGPAETMAKALEIPGGVVDSVELLPDVSADVEVLAQVEVPARSEAVPFVFGEPLPPESTAGDN